MTPTYRRQLHYSHAPEIKLSPTNPHAFSSETNQKTFNSSLSSTFTMNGSFIAGPFSAFPTLFGRIRRVCQYWWWRGVTGRVFSVVVFPANNCCFYWPTFLCRLGRAWWNWATHAWTFGRRYPSLTTVQYAWLWWPVSSAVHKLFFSFSSSDSSFQASYQSPR